MPVSHIMRKDHQIIFLGRCRKSLQRFQRLAQITLHDRCRPADSIVLLHEGTDIGLHFRMVGDTGHFFADGAGA